MRLRRECGEYRARIPDGLAPDEMTMEKATELLEAGAAQHDSLGVDSATGMKMYLLVGRFGPYLQLGERSDEKGAEKPKLKGLLPGMKPEDVTKEIADGFQSVFGNNVAVLTPVVIALSAVGSAFVDNIVCSFTNYEGLICCSQANYLK